VRHNSISFAASREMRFHPLVAEKKTKENQSLIANGPN